MCSRCSVGVVPHTDIFDIFVGWNVISILCLHHLKVPHHPFYTFIIFNYFVFQVLYSWTLIILVFTVTYIIAINNIFIFPQCLRDLDNWDL